MKHLTAKLVFALALTAAGTSASLAQTAPTTQAGTATSAAHTKGAAPSPDMATGEIRKVDKATGKITIKHGEIKNLDMPPMTMVFQLKDPTQLGTLKAGDKIQFKAEMASGAYVVTAIEPAK